MSDEPTIAQEAVWFCDEIERNEKELLDSGWGGYQWEHLGDATKDIHRLIRYIRALAVSPADTTEPCPDCDGVGAQSGAHTERVMDCPECGGAGHKKAGTT